MEVLEAIRTRKSIRAYKPDPVPKEILKQLLEDCARAPSWANTQPWEFAIVGGDVLEELKRRFLEKAAARAEVKMDIPPPTFPDRYMERMRENGRRMFEVMGIAREDRERRRQWSESMPRFFGAPAGIFVYIDRELGPYSILDVGIVLQTLLLAAKAYGLGTCTEAAVVTRPEVLREVLGIPESKLIVIGVAIGYPDMEAPVNQFRSNREPLENFVNWHGFD